MKGDIEKPNNISGVVYVTLDSFGAWKIEVAKELKACGYTINRFIYKYLRPNKRRHSDGFSVAAAVIFIEILILKSKIRVENLTRFVPLRFMELWLKSH
ncbi:hypothetical protein PQI64_21670 [Shewanella bicestrii]